MGKEGTQEGKPDIWGCSSPSLGATAEPREEAAGLEAEQGADTSSDQGQKN